MGIINKDEFTKHQEENLSERFFAVINQKTVIEALAVDHADLGKCFVCEVKTLHSHQYEPNAAQRADGDSIYYRSTEDYDLRMFISKLIARQTFDLSV